MKHKAKIINNETAYHKASQRQNFYDLTVACPFDRLASFN